MPSYGKWAAIVLRSLKPNASSLVLFRSPMNLKCALPDGQSDELRFVFSGVEVFGRQALCKHKKVEDMEDLPCIADVLSAKARVNALQLVLSHNFLAWTWGASYVRLVELVPCGHATIPDVLAVALWNDPSIPEYAPEQWLPHVSFRAANTKAVSELVSHAVSDISQSAASNDLLSHRLTSMDTSAISAIYELAGEPGGHRPAAPRLYGPTYQVMWQSKGMFVFLEVHNES